LILSFIAIILSIIESQVLLLLLALTLTKIAMICILFKSLDSSFDSSFSGKPLWLLFLRLLIFFLALLPKFVLIYAGSIAKNCSLVHQLKKSKLRWQWKIFGSACQFFRPCL